MFLVFTASAFPSLVVLDLSEALRSSVEFVRPIAQQACVSLMFTADPIVKVLGNSSALQQVVLNIVCNAIRHTHKGGVVSVSVRALRKIGDNSAAMSAQ